MKKEEFIRQLEYLLQDISEEDRNEAVNYYLDYLEEAGPENEEAVLQEFGSPERIAAIIRADLNGNLEDGGSFTESGYEDERFRDPNYQVANRLDLPDVEVVEQKEEKKEKTEEKKPWTNGFLKVVLCLILLAVAFPFAVGIGGTTLGIFIAIVAVVGVFFLLAGLSTVLLLVGGVCAVFVGFATLAVNLMDAVCIIGVGFLCIGIGVLALLVSIWFYGKVIPRIFRGVGKGIDTLCDWARRKRG